MRASNSPWSVPAWAFAVAAGIALILAFALYGPALDGPFLFDDLGLPFYAPSFARQPLFGWISGVRPLLMFSYWLNYQLSERDPWSYHAGNVLLHSASSVLVFIFLLRILRLCSIDARKAVFPAAIASILFLAHPLQTEAVAYIAGRSELLAAFFVLAALAVYTDPKIDVDLRAYCAYCSRPLPLRSPFQGAGRRVAGDPVLIDVLLRPSFDRRNVELGKRLYYPLAGLGIARR